MQPSTRFAEMSSLLVHAFKSTAELDAALATNVAESLRQGIRNRGEALLCVSGGKTPAGFLAALSAHEIDWRCIVVTLADERWVDESSPYSNARLIRQHLLQGPASLARFVPLYHPAPTPAGSALIASQYLAQNKQAFDALVLGMGDDAHTASIFPGSPQLHAALGDATGHACIAVQGKSPVPDRLTLTLRRLQRTRNLFLHITGETKWDLLGVALMAPTPELPISLLLDTHCDSRHVYWTR